MQDVFVEYMVRRRSTPKLALAKIGIILALVAALAALALLVGPGLLSIVGVVIVCCVAYRLITSLNVEYEYTVTNGELDIDVIVARRRRKRLASVNCREVESFGRYRAGEHSRASYGPRILACDSPSSNELWCCATRAEGRGRALYVFNANQKMLDAIRPFLPGAVRREAFGG